MTDETVPFGALLGFCLAHEYRLLAACHGVTVKQIKTMRENEPRAVTHARHALMWRLRTQYSFSDGKIARLLHCSRRAAGDGATSHAARIRAFREAHQIEAPK